MWGTHEQKLLTALSQRFIPTHVGNTSAAAFWARVISVHPHACGEHTISRKQTGHSTGSSPRMWGTRENCRVQHSIDRFIPTHVGNTLNKPSKRMWRTVHPHACGEHFISISGKSTSIGSSPRMWGTHFFQVSDDIKFSKNIKLYQNFGALKMDSNLETSFLFFDFFRRLFRNKRNEPYAVHFFGNTAVFPKG